MTWISPSAIDTSSNIATFTVIAADGRGGVVGGGGVDGEWSCWLGGAFPGGLEPDDCSRQADTSSRHPINAHFDIW